jgi:hypothetical protein
LTSCNCNTGSSGANGGYITILLFCNIPLLTKNKCTLKLLQHRSTSDAFHSVQALRAVRIRKVQSGA